MTRYNFKSIILISALAVALVSCGKATKEEGEEVTERFINMKDNIYNMFLFIEVKVW